MAAIVHEVTIARPPSEVFAVLSHVERLPEFSEMTVGVQNGPGRPLRVGDRFDQIVKILGVEVDTEWEVTGVTENTSIELHGRSKANGRATLSHHLTPTGAGCSVRMEVDYDPPFGILGEIADKLVFERRNEEEAEHILARLKDLCERASMV